MPEPLKAYAYAIIPGHALRLASRSRVTPATPASLYTATQAWRHAEGQLQAEAILFMSLKATATPLLVCDDYI